MHHGETLHSTVLSSWHTSVRANQSEYEKQLSKGYCFSLHSSDSLIAIDVLNASAPLGGYTLDPAPGVYLMCWAVNPQYARDIIVPIGEFVSIGVIAESIFPRTCYLGSASRLSL